MRSQVVVAGVVEVNRRYARSSKQLSAPDPATAVTMRRRRGRRPGTVRTTSVSAFVRWCRRCPRSRAAAAGHRWGRPLPVRVRPRTRPASSRSLRTPRSCAVRRSPDRRTARGRCPEETASPRRLVIAARSWPDDRFRSGGAHHRCTVVAGRSASFRWRTSRARSRTAGSAGAGRRSREFRGHSRTNRRPPARTARRGPRRRIRRSSGERPHRSFERLLPRHRYPS